MAPQTSYYSPLSANSTTERQAYPAVVGAFAGFAAVLLLGLGVLSAQQTGDRAIATFVPNLRAQRSFVGPQVVQRPQTALNVVVDPAEFKKGLTVEMDGIPYKIVDYQHSKQARQAAVIRTKMQNMLTGGMLDKTFRSGERLEKAEIEYSEVTFTYKDGDDYCFTSMETFAEERLPATLLGDKIGYLSEGLSVKVARFNGKAIDMELPTNLEIEIVDTEPGEQGDRQNAGTKPATLAGGKVIQVPLFVNIGDMVKIDTREDRYITRVK